MVEGFQTTIGSTFQLETLRTVTQIPVRAALNTHWHFDHTLGNSVYGGAGIPIWAHADVPRAWPRITPNGSREDLETFLAPWEKRVRDAKTDSQREHAKSDIEGLTGMFVPVSQTVLALPNHPLDPAKMPMEIDLGGLTVVIETYIGHTDTDLIFRVPDQNVIYTGDLLTGGQYPVNINGYPIEVARDARQIRHLRQKHALRSRPRPDHGPGRRSGNALLLRRHRRTSRKILQGRRPRGRCRRTLRRPRQIQKLPHVSPGASPSAAPTSSFTRSGPASR